MRLLDIASNLTVQVISKFTLDLNLPQQTQAHVFLESLFLEFSD